MHVDEWDFDAVATNMETEHVETADEAADAAALRNVLWEGLEEPEWGEEWLCGGAPGGKRATKAAGLAQIFKALATNHALRTLDLTGNAIGTSRAPYALSEAVH